MKSPFPLAPYKGKKAIGHIIQKEKAREACVGIEEGDERGGGQKKLSEYFAVFHISSLSTVPLSMAATPTCDITYSNTGGFFRFAVFLAR